MMGIANAYAGRLKIHAKTAEALEGLYCMKAGIHVSKLAFHFIRAKALLGSEKVLKYSLLAGEKALSGHAHEEAVKWFEHGFGATAQRRWNIYLPLWK